jgi:DNA-binding GntR family transcriptional regulator
MMADRNDDDVLNDEMEKAPTRRAKMESKWQPRPRRKGLPPEVSIRERHLSPALRLFPAEKLRTLPLSGAKARVYNRLWRPIADGRMKTGAKLVEADLEGVFGVSRTVIRSVLEHMAAEGYVAMPFNHSAHVVEPTPEEAMAVFETLGLVMTHIITKLAAPERSLSAQQRQLIELHLSAQSDADKVGEPIAAHLLGVEFLILLAATYGATLFTDLIARTVVLETLSLKAYGQFPPPAWYIAFQTNLTEAIFSRKQDLALTEFNQRLTHIQSTLRFDSAKGYEEDNLIVLLGDDGS